MSFIEIKNLKVSYHNNSQDIVALDDVNACFQDGKITAIVGPSGSGKSTLIRTICGFLDYEGTILSNNENYASINYKKRNTSYVDQSITLNPHLDVYNNIASSLIIKKVSRLEIDKKIKKLLKDLNIEKCLSLFLSELSVGQAQLTLLAKAIIKDPDLLLLDEAFSNLDQTNKNHFIKLIKEKQKENPTTILFVTHKFEEVSLLADCVIIMEKGKIKEIIDRTDMKFTFIKEIMENNGYEH